MPFEWREVVNTRGMTRHHLEISSDGAEMGVTRDTRFEALHAMREWVEAVKDAPPGLLIALNEAETHDR